MALRSFGDCTPTAGFDGIDSARRQDGFDNARAADSQIRLTDLIRLTKAQMAIVSTPETGRMSGEQGHYYSCMSMIEELSDRVNERKCGTSLIMAYDFANSSSKADCARCEPDRHMNASDWKRPEKIRDSQWFRYWMGRVRGVLTSLLSSVQPLGEPTIVGSLELPEDSRHCVAFSIQGGAISQTEYMSLGRIIHGVVSDISGRDCSSMSTSMSKTRFYIWWVHFKDIFELYDALRGKALVDPYKYFYLGAKALAKPMEVHFPPYLANPKQQRSLLNEKRESELPCCSRVQATQGGQQEGSRPGSAQKTATPPVGHGWQPLHSQANTPRSASPPLGGSAHNVARPSLQNGARGGKEFHNNEDLRLVKAVEIADIGMVTRLLDKRADPNELNSRGCPVLHVAVVDGQVEIAELLLAAKADVHSKDPQGWTALSIVSYGACASNLTMEGRALGLRDSILSVLAAHGAGERLEPSSAQADARAIVEDRRPSGSLTAPRPASPTALHGAGPPLAATRQFVQVHADPLVQAIRSKDLKKVKAFMARGKMPDECFETWDVCLSGKEPEKYIFSALQISVATLELEITQLLLDAKASPDLQRMWKRMNPDADPIETQAFIDCTLMVVTGSQSTRLVIEDEQRKFLRDMLSKTKTYEDFPMALTDRLYEAVCCRNPFEVQTLLENRANPNGGYFALPILHVAVRGVNASIVKMLLAYKADKDVSTGAGLHDGAPVYTARDYLEDKDFFLDARHRDARVENELYTLVAGHEVQSYPGFTAFTYRFLFPYEDKFATPYRKLLTILPSGAIENEPKELVPKKEKALIGFVKAKTLDPEAAEHFDELEPCVWRRSDGTYAVVQTWTTNYDQSFKSSFKIATENPDPRIFERQAVKEFRMMVENLFGWEETTGHSTLFCSKQTVTNAPAFVGVAEKLLEFVRLNPDVQAALGILTVGEDSNGPNPLAFITSVRSKKGAAEKMAFTLEQGTWYVLYVKEGYNTMACVKQLDDFRAEATFHDPKPVRKYSGFTERTFRMLFEFADRYPDVRPRLQTIDGAGLVHNDSALEPKPEKALITYAFRQTLAEEKVEEFKDSPFVHRREDGSHDVVQTWPTKFNDSFKKAYTISNELKNHNYFSEEAAARFKQTVVQLFGKAAETQHVLFCERTAVNDKDCYVGMSESLMWFLCSHPDVADVLGIELFKPGMEPTPLSFISHVVDGQGVRKTKTFQMDPGVMYVLYTKIGWETMACVKTLVQFYADHSTLGQEVGMYQPPRASSAHKPLVQLSSSPVVSASVAASVGSAFRLGHRLGHILKRQTSRCSSSEVTGEEKVAPAPVRPVLSTEEAPNAYGCLTSEFVAFLQGLAFDLATGYDEMLAAAARVAMDKVRETSAFAREPLPGPASGYTFIWGVRALLRGAVSSMPVTQVNFGHSTRAVHWHMHHGTESLCGILGLHSQADVYFSHAQSEDVRVTLDAMQEHSRLHSGGDAGQPMRYWLDYMSIPQTSGGFSEEKTRRVIEAIGTLAIVMEPWDSPAATQRLWCCFEVGVAAQTKTCNVHAALTKRQQEQVLAALEGNTSHIVAHLTRFDARRSKATDEQDFKAIQACIETGCGFDSINEQLAAALFESVLQMCTRLSVDEKDEKRANALRAALAKLCSSGSRWS